MARTLICKKYLSWWTESDLRIGRCSEREEEFIMDETKTI
jgi:hypothetical protein